MLETHIYGGKLSSAELTAGPAATQNFCGGALYPLYVAPPIVPGRGRQVPGFSPDLFGTGWIESHTCAFSWASFLAGAPTNACGALAFHQESNSKTWERALVSSFPRVFVLELTVWLQNMGRQEFPDNCIAVLNRLCGGGSLTFCVGEN